MNQKNNNETTTTTTTTEQTTTTETTGPIDLKQFGLEATANKNQASGNGDYSQYFKETKTTTTRTGASATTK